MACQFADDIFVDDLCARDFADVDSFSSACSFAQGRGGHVEGEEVFRKRRTAGARARPSGAPSGSGAGRAVSTHGDTAAGGA